MARFVVRPALLVSLFFVALALALAPRSSAQDTTHVWSDAAGRLAFRYPAEWSIMGAGRTSPPPVLRRVFVGGGAFECQIWSISDPATASLTADRLKAAFAHPVAADDWTRLALPVDYFNGHVDVAAQSVDATGAWPIQHADLRGPSAQVRATMQARPGVQLVSMCLSFDGADRSADFARVEASIGLPEEITAAH